MAACLGPSVTPPSVLGPLSRLPVSLLTGEVGVGDQAQLSLFFLPTKVIPLVTGRALLVRASERKEKRTEL